MNCPTCGKPMEKPTGRVCSECGLQILRYHKWFFVDGRARHRVCADPKQYAAQSIEQPTLLDSEVVA